MSSLSSVSSLPRPRSTGKPFAARSDASVRDSVRILSEIVTQLSERIEILEARAALVDRTR